MVADGCINLEAGSGSALEEKAGSGSGSALKSKFRSFRGLKWSRGRWQSRFKIEPWRFCRQFVADSHQVDEEQDPEPHWSKKVDPDPHWNDRDPQPWLHLKLFFTSLQIWLYLKPLRRDKIKCELGLLLWRTFVCFRTEFIDHVYDTVLKLWVSGSDLFDKKRKKQWSMQAFSGFY